MPIYIKTDNPTNYVKVKGKIYKKTGNVLTTFGTYVTSNSAIISYNLLDEADFKNVRKQDVQIKLRPVYACITTETFTPATVNSDTNTYNLTVITKQTGHPFFSQGNSSCLSVSGVHAAPLNLIRGKKYSFKQTDSSNTGHKAVVTSDAQGLTPIVIPDNTYTGTAGSNGILTFIIPLTSQDTLYLSSEGGEYMGIRINIDRFIESMPNVFNNYQQLSGLDFFTPLSSI